MPAAPSSSAGLGRDGDLSGLALCPHKRTLDTVTERIDPEGVHLSALRRLADFHGQRVLELGCGDGRLTIGVAADATAVVAFDPDADAIDRAKSSLPNALADRVTYLVASGKSIEIEPNAFDLVLFSWSL